MEILKEISLRHTTANTCFEIGKDDTLLMGI
jgi:hypothetical protein